ncbi:DUF1672 family protein [Neobacillus sp. LXY-1]|uniref:DUF1672 family protein n=1 Tax=Neobacillus sp. LXY-1 TaxID=3379133 RepID=UPI003EE28C6E
MSNETVDKKNAEDGYMPVQDYTGQGYSFNNGDKTGEFAKKHRQKIIDKVNQYFRDKYGLNVQVHNLVGAKNAVVAFVESRQEPKFHTSVIVGVDLQNQKVGDVGAYEGVVEGAITSGLYVMAYEKEFQNLDTFCEQIAKKYPVMGMREEAVNNTMDSGYSTPFYYTSTLDSFFPNAYNAYTVDHTISKDKVHNLISSDLFKQDFNTLEISLTFYIKKRYDNPNQKMADDIIREFNQTTGLPPGNYGIFIQSNEVLKRTGTAKSHKGTITGKTDIIVKP